MSKHDLPDRSGENTMALTISGKVHWVPSLPMPFFTTAGLPWWKRANEKNWRPQCKCKQIFETLEDYHAHILYWNSAYGIAKMQERGEK